MKEYFQRYRSALSAVGTIAGFYLLLFLLDITCPIKFVTGISCAGCGMTRAWLQVFRLNFSSAVAFHPLFWTVPILLACFLLRRRFPTVTKVIFGIIAVLFIVTYAVRMLDANCKVVVFEPRHSVFFRIVEHFISY